MFIFKWNKKHPTKVYAGQDGRHLFPGSNFVDDEFGKKCQEDGAVKALVKSKALVITSAKSKADVIKTIPAVNDFNSLKALENDTDPAIAKAAKEKIAEILKREQEGTGEGDASTDDSEGEGDPE